MFVFPNVQIRTSNDQALNNKLESTENVPDKIVILPESTLKSKWEIMGNQCNRNSKENLKF